MPQCRLHWLLRLSFYVASSYKHKHIHICTASLPHTLAHSAHTHTFRRLRHKVAALLRFSAASAVAATALKQLALRIVVVVVVASMPMTVTTACNMLSTRHAKILLQQLQHLLRVCFGRRACHWFACGCSITSENSPYAAYNLSF